MAAPKKGADKTAFDIFLGLNNTFHDYMAKLSESKVEEDVAYIDVDIIKSIYKDSANALNELEANPKFKNYYDQFKLWASAPMKIIDAFPAVGGVIVMPADALNQFVGQVLNHMANLVHSAAYDSVTTTGQLKACQVASFKPDDAAAVNKYCSGAKPGGIIVQQVPVKKKKIGDKTWIQHYPSLIQQKLGLHSVMPSFQTSGDEIASAVEYHDSYLNHLGSANRLRGVKERLELLGFQCNIGGVEGGKYQQYKDIYCNADSIAPDTIRELATFFSILLDADIHIPHDKEAYKVVRDKAWELAVARNAQYGDETWQSPNFNKPNWESLYNQWKEEEQYTKNIIYSDLRQLLVLRDMHHMVEEHYGIPEGKATMEGMKLVLKNGLKMQEIMNKHGWGSIQSDLNKISKHVKQGTATNIAGPSDMIGHIAHAAVFNQLAKAKQYGNCDMTGNIANISGGNLAYCEGILQGEYGTVVGQSAGNTWIHKIVPSTITVSVDEDDFADYQYSFKINLPEDKALKYYLKGWLNDLGFSCSANICKVATKSLDEIRQMALFLSNLRGVDSKVGEQCAQKALESAAAVAVEQGKKGIFAFTQQPIHNNTKEWIDMCFKQHGIMPPGMTKEEAEILKLIGANKVYGGCTFEGSDILPNLGFIKYCEGVRKNKTANVNAAFATDGTLNHYFHGPPGAPDMIANISITPVENNNYEVSLSNIDLRDKKPDKPFHKQVINRLKSIGLTCPSITQCSTAKAPLSEAAVRHLGSYLSSLHQAYNVDSACIKAAEEYAWNHATALPNDITAHDSAAYPFELSEWNAEVCAKIGKPPEPAKKVEPEPAVAGKIFYVHDVLKNIKATKKWGAIGGCQNATAQKPTIAVGKFCYGIQPNFEEAGKAIKKYPAVRHPHSNEFYLAGLKKPIVFTSKGYDLYMTLPDELMHPALIHGLSELHWPQDGTNTFHSKYNIFKGGKFLSYLHNFTNIPEDCKEAAVANAVAAAKKSTYGEVVKPYDMPAWEQFCAAAVGVPKLSIKQVAAINVLTNPLQHNASQVEDALFIMGDTGEIAKCFGGKTGHPQSILCDLWKEGHPTKFTDEELKYLWQQCLFESYPNIFQSPAPTKKTVAFSELSAQAQANIQKQVCDLKDLGWALDGVLGNISSNWPMLQFGAMTKGIITQMYEACPTILKKFGTTKELSDFLLNFLKESPVVSFNVKDFPDIIKKAGYDPPGLNIIISELESLTAAGKLIKGAGQNYWYEPEPVMALPDIDTLIEEEALELEKALGKIDQATWDKAGEITQYKKLPLTVKNWMHHWFNLLLLNGHKTGHSYNAIIEEAQKYLLEGLKLKITPLMIKLQLDIEKNKKVCEGKLPADIGQTKEEACNIAETAEKAEEEGKTPFSQLSTTAQDSIAAKVADWAGQDLSPADIWDKVEQEWPDIIIDGTLSDFIFKAAKKIQEVKAKEKGLEWVEYLKVYVPKDVLNPTIDNIASMDDAGLSLPNIVQNCYTGWWTENVNPNLFKNWVKEVLALGEKKAPEYGTIEGALILLKKYPDKWFYGGSMYEAWEEHTIDLGEPPGLAPLTEALDKLHKEGLVEKNEQGYYRFLKKTKKAKFKGAANKEALMFNAVGIIGQAPGKQMSYPAIYNKLSESYLFTDSDLSEALNDLVEEGTLKDVGKEDYAIVEPETKHWDDLTEEEKLEFAQDIIKNNITSWEELKEFLEENYIYAEEEEVPSLWEMQEMAEKYQESLAEPDFATTKATALNIINAAPYDFDWSLEYIIDEFSDYKLKSPEEAELYKALQELVDEHKITVETVHGPWHSKLEVKEMPDGTKMLVPIEKGSFMALIPSAKKELIDKASHLVFTKKPDAVKTILTSEFDIVSTPELESMIKQMWHQAIDTGSVNKAEFYKQYELEAEFDEQAHEFNKQTLLDYLESQGGAAHIDAITDSASGELTPEEIDKILQDLIDEGKIWENLKTGVYTAVEKDVKWYFQVASKEYGLEVFGPYDTDTDAETAINNVKATAAKLKDGIVREYSDPYLESILKGMTEHDAQPTYAVEEIGVKSIIELTDDQIKEAGDFMLSKMKEGISLPVIKAQLADLFPGGIKLDDDYSNWFSGVAEMITKDYPGLIEKGVFFGDLTMETKQIITDYIQPLLEEPFDSIYDTVAAEFNVKKSKAFKDWLKGVVAKEEIKLKPYGELPHKEKVKIVKRAKELAEKGLSIFEVADMLTDEYYKELWDLDLKQVIKELVIEQQKAEEAKWEEEVKEEEEQVAPLNFSDLSYDEKMNIEQEAKDLFKKGYLADNIVKYIADKYKLWEDSILDKAIKAAITGIEPEEPPSPSEAVLQESMADFIKAGMSAKAVTELFADQLGESKAKKVSEKLYNLYHPDQEVMKMAYSQLPKWTQEVIKARAQAMLNKGKTQEDTAWYLAYNYHITKEGAQNVVKSLAKIPISKTEELLKAFKILGVGEELGGCKVSSVSLDLLKGQTVSYCQGVVAPISQKPHAEIFDKGEMVEHKTDHQEIVVTTEASEAAWETSVLRGEDDLGVNIKDNIARILRDWGFSCEEAAGALDCKLRGSDGQTMSIEDQDTLRKTALFLSSIDHVPELSESCIPYAMEYARNHAIGINKTSKPWTVPVHPHTVEEWDKTVCSKVGAQ